MEGCMSEVIAQMARGIDRSERDHRRWKRSMTGTLVCALLLFLEGIDRPRTIEAQQPGQRKEDARSAASLIEARIKVAQRALNSINQRIISGVGIMNRDNLIYMWSRRLLLAQLETSPSEDERVAFLEAYLARMKDLEKRVDGHFRERRISDIEYMDAQFRRLEAETWLVKVRQGESPWIIVINP
jgi:hypothetical protein